MGGTLYYENKRNASLASRLTEQEKAVIRARERGFPNCKGLYPDCPETPTKETRMCRLCPVLAEDF